MKKIVLQPIRFLLFSFLMCLPFIGQTSRIMNEKKIPAAQKQDIVNGYGKDLHGEIIDYHSCHPEANSALLIRCQNNTDYIEWETEAAQKTNDPFVTFAWIAGYASGTSSRDHQYQLFVNDKPYFIIQTSKGASGADWKVSGPSDSELNFKYAKADGINDLYGYLFLKVRKSELNSEGKLRLKVTGDATNSSDWYMTFRYGYSNKVTITQEEVVLKGENGRQLQRVKVGIDHFSTPSDYKMTCEGKVVAQGKLNFGINYAYLTFDRVTSDVQKKIELTVNNQKKAYDFTLSPVRDYTVYLLSHSHVDIGYTELQSKVMELQCKNIDNAIDLAEKTADYPEDARFKWNCEVLWPLEGYLKNATPEKRKHFFDAVRRGQVGIDGLYSNELLGLCRPEELYHAFDFSNQLQKEDGIKIESSMISDVPGYSWGIVPAMAFNGIKYFSIGPNPFDRIGHTISTWGDKPFYWKSPSGKDKVLVWITSLGYATFHGGSLPRTEAAPLLSLLKKLNQTNYPYDMVMVRYTIGGDNGYPDIELPDYVKTWNEKYISPKLKISLTVPMFKDFESKYGTQLPTYSGDFTPYWEDGAGSSALETAMNRQSAERISQAEVLWSLTNPSKFPFNQFYDAWNNVLLYSEHTWGAHNSISEPESPFVKGQWAVKQLFALKADSISKALLNEVKTALTDPNARQNGVNVLNASSWNRNDLVTLPTGLIPGKGIMSLSDEDGNLCPLQKLTNGEYVFKSTVVPAMGNIFYKFSRSESQTKLQMSVTENTLENDFYKVVLDPMTGNISQLIRKSDNQNLAETEGLNAYVYTGSDASNPRTNPKPVIRKGEEGPVVCSLVVESDAPGCKKLTREVRLIAGTDRIDIINTVDKEKVLDKENVRFAFPFNISNPETRMDMAWAVVRPEKDQLAGANKNYYTIQRWVDVSNDKNGVTLASPDAPLLEVGGMLGEDWKKGPGQSWATHASSSSRLYSWVMNNSWHTNYKAYQEGPVVFNYSIWGHADFDAAIANRFGTSISQPLISIPAGKSINPVFVLDDETPIVITSIRPSEDGKGLIARLYNPTPVKAKTIIHSRLSKPVSVYAINDAKDQGIEIVPEIKLEGYGIRTIRVE
ncbi:MAG: glycoside hydrolase family 38 C-terminal domain-containing protein [Bacteroidota bacterium]|nr:glycoside hydrolase family 38 C-terminal domain-containing protein [Bacteroidota bacterium]MDP4205477.1 glycoside hydrolase family 38 C-terminal domain-containing protein [Bacteroidota bacterium]